MSERSASRGRDLASTGRGGAGNIVREESIDRTPDGDERGRDVIPRDETTRVTHAGRGGQGNVRSPSRDPAKEAAERVYEEEVLRKSREHREKYGLSSGRGGVGNISRSRSRSREPGFAATGAYEASGRGGAGNIHSHDHVHIAGELEKLDEEERAVAEGKHPHGFLSHGRGGQGNLGPQDAELPNGTGVAPVDVGSHHGGRGGSGNVFA